MGQIVTSNEGGALDLHYKVDRLDLSIGSDLDESLLAPRIDASAQDTYFWLRADLALCSRVKLFAESYQGASSVVKTTTIPSNKFIWDGVWLRPGIIYNSRWGLFEGGPVLYMRSSSGRTDQWGALFSIRWDF